MSAYQGYDSYEAEQQRKRMSATSGAYPSTYGYPGYAGYPGMASYPGSGMVPLTASVPYPPGMPQLHPAIRQLSYPPSMVLPVSGTAATNPPQSTSRIVSWLLDTPLPTAIAFEAESGMRLQQDGHDDGAVGMEPPVQLELAPGRGKGAAKANAAPREKTKEERKLELRKEAKAREKGFSVGGGFGVAPIGHDPASLFYNPIALARNDPLAAMDPSILEAREKARPKNAVSASGARALAEEAVKVASDSEQDASSELESESSSDLVLGRRVGDSEDSEEEDSAMDKVRDRILQLAQARNLLNPAPSSSDSSSEDDNEPLHNHATIISLTTVNDLDDDEMPLVNLTPQQQQNLIFRTPGRAGRAATVKSGFEGKACSIYERDEADLDARQLLDDMNDGDSSDSDNENAAVRNYFQSIAADPPLAHADDADDEAEDATGQDALPLAQLIALQMTDPDNTDDSTPESDATRDENKIRHRIYTDLVPALQTPKTNSAQALRATQDLLPLISALTNYPADQRALTDTCFATLGVIARMRSMVEPAVAGAQVALAHLWVRGVPDYEQDTHRPDFHRAFGLYESAARRGDLDAIFNVALCFEKGVGVGVSLRKAVHNYKKAALRNHPGAMFRLGTGLMKGTLGLPVNERDGIKWLRLATKYATHAYPHALYEFALLHADGVPGLVYPDAQFMVEMLAQGARLGHGGCQVKLGEIFGEALYGVPKSVGRSVYFYGLAAGQGHPEGMFALGGIYLSGADDDEAGVHVPASVSESVRWVNLAAQCGLPRAMFAMGYFAESGMTEKGVGSPNEKAALQWYKKAAVAGESKAVKRLEELGVAIDWKAFKKLEKMEQNALQVGGGVAPVGDVAKRVQKGVADGIGEIKNKFVGRHSEVDEELDGGHKCAIM